MEHRIGPEAGFTLLGYNKNWYPNIIFYNERNIEKYSSDTRRRNTDFE